jgi:hypothetical protein
VEQLEELLLRNEPALLDEFLSEMVPLQVTHTTAVAVVRQVCAPSLLPHTHTHIRSWSSNSSLTACLLTLTSHS